MCNRTCFSASDSGISEKTHHSCKSAQEISQKASPYPKRKNCKKITMILTLVKYFFNITFRKYELFL